MNLSELKSLVEIEKKKARLILCESELITKYDQQSGMPFVRIRDPKRPNLRGARISKFPGLVTLRSGYKVVVVEVFLEHRGQQWSQNVAFYQSSGKNTPKLSAKGQWVPFGGIAYRGHLAGLGEWNWILKHSGGKTNNPYRIIGEWLESIDRNPKLNFPRHYRLDLTDAQLNKILNDSGALRRDWLPNAAGGSQFAGVDKVKKVTIIPGKEAIGPNGKPLVAGRMSARHLESVKLKYNIAAEILSPYEYKIFRRVMDYRQTNELEYAEYRNKQDNIEKNIRDKGHQPGRAQVLGFDANDVDNILNKVEVEYDTRRSKALRSKAGFAGMGVGLAVPLPNFGRPLSTRAKQKAQALGNKLIYNVKTPLQVFIPAANEIRAKVGSFKDPLARNLGAYATRTVERSKNWKTYAAPGVLDFAFLGLGVYQIMDNKKMSLRQQEKALIQLAKDTAKDTAIGVSVCVASGPGCVAYMAYGIAMLADAIGPAILEAGISAGRWAEENIGKPIDDFLNGIFADVAEGLNSMLGIDKDAADRSRRYDFDDYGGMDSSAQDRRDAQDCADYHRNDIRYNAKTGGCVYLGARDKPSCDGVGGRWYEGLCYVDGHSETGGLPALKCPDGYISGETLGLDPKRCYKCTDKLADWADNKFSGGGMAAAIRKGCPGGDKEY